MAQSTARRLKTCHFDLVLPVGDRVHEDEARAHFYATHVGVHDVRDTLLNQELALTAEDRLLL